MAAVLRAMAAARAAEAEQAKAPPLSEEEQALLEQVLAEAEEGAAGLVRVLPPERLPVRAVLSAELLAAARAAEAGAEYARRERARAEEALSLKAARATAASAHAAVCTAASLAAAASPLANSPAAALPSAGQPSSNPFAASRPHSPTTLGRLRVAAHAAQFTPRLPRRHVVSAQQSSAQRPCLVQSCLRIVPVAIPAAIPAAAVAADTERHTRHE